MLNPIPPPPAACPRQRRCRPSPAAARAPDRDRAGIKSRHGRRIDDLPHPAARPPQPLSTGL